MLIQRPADRLVVELEGALARCEKRRWEQLADECVRIGRADLPDVVRQRFPVLAEAFDRT